MTKKQAEFIQQLLDQAGREIWAVALHFGLNKTDETVEMLNLATWAITALHAEEVGQVVEFDADLAASAEALPKHYLDLAMAGIFIQAGRNDLANREYEKAIHSGVMAIQMLGFSRGRPRIDQIKEVISESLAKRGIRKHQIYTYRDKDDAKKYWLENIDPTVSNIDAAEILHSKFSKEYEISTYQKKWIPEWKKDLLKRK